MADQQQSKIIDVGVGWLKTSRKGDQYMSIKLGQDGFTTQRGTYIPGTKIYLVKEGEEDKPIEISGKFLNLFFKKEKKSDKSPDASICMFED